MSYIDPNFKISEIQTEEVVSPMEDSNGNVNEFLLAENLSTEPILTTSKINKTRVLLSSLGGTKSMWLYPNGKIKVER